MLQLAISIQHALGVVGLLAILLAAPLWLVQKHKKPLRSSSWSQFQQDWRDYRAQFDQSMRLRP
jgi:hypothetical protein